MAVSAPAAAGPVRRLAAAAILLCCQTTVQAAVAPDDALTGTLAALQARSALPGFAVALVSPDGVTYQRGFGLADLDSKRPYTEHTLQNMGSVSKTVVGVAVAKAIELGYFTLDTEINAILPFRVRHPRHATPITVRHLLTHTSGIVDDDAVYGHSYYVMPHADMSGPLVRPFQRTFTVAGRRDLSLDGFLRHYLMQGGRHYRRSNFARAKPGSAYAYSNIGAALAAYLVERKAGVSFERFTQEHIFGPLGMHDTAWRASAATAPRHARLYNPRRQAYPAYGLITYPDGGLTTSAADMGRYLAAMMRGHATPDDGKILGAAGFRLLFAPQFDADALPVDSPKGEPNSGLLWRIKPDGQIGHTGSDPGITTFMFFDPATRTGKLLMTNTEFSGIGDEDDDPRIGADFMAVWKALDGAAPPAPPTR